MQIVHGFTSVPETARGSVIALGNFDGVHLGHRHVIDLARALADEVGGELGVALFDPHPRRFFAPDAPAFRLMSASRRDRTLAALGVGRLHVLPFDGEMAKRTPREFVEDVLVRGLGVKGLVTGADFRFGAGRAGSTGDMERLCAEHGVRTAFAELHGNGADKVSSTRIRKAILDGDMHAAEALLGAPWAVEGTVLPGDRRGRTIGFPTANLDLGDFARPAYGVYAVRVGIEGEAPLRPAVANFGKRPTVDGVTELLEIHLFDFSGDLYGKVLEVEFHEFLRPERRFDGIEALKAQIAADADAARRLLTDVSGPA